MMWGYKGITNNENHIALNFKILFCYRKYGAALFSISHLKFCFVSSLTGQVISITTGTTPLLLLHQNPRAL